MLGIRNLRRRNITLLLILVLFFISLGYFKINIFIKNSLFDILYPTVKVVSNIKEIFISSFDYFKSKKLLVLENTILKEEINSYKRILRNSEKIEFDNKKLKKSLNYSEKTSSKFITARLLLANSNSYYHQGFIELDSKYHFNSNLSLLNAPILFNDVLVGRVYEKFNNKFRILFLKSFNSRVSIKILPSGERGILYGSSNNELSIKYIKYISKINIGDLVITSGDGNYYSEGIIIGRVNNINGDLVKVSQPVNIEDIEFVKILIK